MPTRVVYTALLGGYETLNDSQAASPGVDFICFTDDPSVTSHRWDIQLVSPEFVSDPHRSQRRLKIMGHPILETYEESLYIDNSVALTADANSLFDAWLPAGVDIAFAKHSFRPTVAHEFAAVVAEGLDDHYRVTEQWDHYSSAMPEVLDAMVLWGGMTARRHGSSVREFNENWYHHVLRYSRRDQLSLQAALLASTLAVKVVELDNHTSEFHRWPVAQGRRQQMRLAAAALRTPQRLREVIDLTRLEAERAALVLEVDRLRASERELAQRETALRNSASWRVTAPARAIVAALHRIF